MYIRGSREDALVFLTACNRDNKKIEYACLKRQPDDTETL